MNVKYIIAAGMRGRSHAYEKTEKWQKKQQQLNKMLCQRSIMNSSNRKRFAF